MPDFAHLAPICFVVVSTSALGCSTSGPAPADDASIRNDVDPPAREDAGSTTPAVDASGADSIEPVSPSKPSDLSILTFGANRTKVGRTDVARIELIIGSPDGPDRIAGARLLDGAGRAFGAFTPSSTKATFFFDVSWSVVDGVAPVEGWSASHALTFVAEVFDTDGGVVRSDPGAPIRLELVCSSADRVCSTSCAGSVDLGKACGRCERACEAEVCVEGRCGPIAGGEPNKSFTRCLPVEALAPRANCRDLCRGVGRTCDQAFAVVGVGDKCEGRATSTHCGSSPTEWHPDWKWIECFCGPGSTP
jgi:hypothetical protein